MDVNQEFTQDSVISNIEVEVWLGTPLEDAIAEVVKLANTLDRPITLIFNKKKLLIFPGITAAEIESFWRLFE